MKIRRDTIYSAVEVSNTLKIPTIKDVSNNNINKGTIYLNADSNELYSNNQSLTTLSSILNKTSDTNGENIVFPNYNQTPNTGYLYLPVIPDINTIPLNPSSERNNAGAIAYNMSNDIAYIFNGTQWTPLNGGGGGGGCCSLSQTLQIGNATNGQDIILSDTSTASSLLCNNYTESSVNAGFIRVTQMSRADGGPGTLFPTTSGSGHLAFEKDTNSLNVFDADSGRWKPLLTSVQNETERPTPEYINTSTIRLAGRIQAPDIVYLSELVSGENIQFEADFDPSYKGIRSYRISSNAVSRNGDTMTGVLDMSGNRIQNVANPSNPLDVATKQYVDDNIGGNLTWEDTLLLGNTSGTSLASRPIIQQDAGLLSAYSLEFDTSGTTGSGLSTIGKKDGGDLNIINENRGYLFIETRDTMKSGGIQLSSGNSRNSGHVTIQSGSYVDVSGSSGSIGNLIMRTGNHTGIGTDANPGFIRMETGFGTLNTGYMDLITGGSTNGNSGPIRIITGDSTFGESGNLTLSSGSGEAGSGNVSISSGYSTQNSGGITINSSFCDGASGIVSILTGSSTNGTSGILFLNTGTGNLSSGRIEMTTGNANGASGNILQKTGTGTNGNSGQIGISTGEILDASGIYNTGTILCSTGSCIGTNISGFKSGNIIINTGQGNFKNSTGSISIYTGTNEVERGPVPPFFPRYSGMISMSTGSVIETNSGDINIQTGEVTTGPSGEFEFGANSGNIKIQTGNNSFSITGNIVMATGQYNYDISGGVNRASGDLRFETGSVVPDSNSVGDIVFRTGDNSLNTLSYNSGNIEFRIGNESNDFYNGPILNLKKSRFDNTIENQVLIQSKLKIGYYSGPSNIEPSQLIRKLERKVLDTVTPLTLTARDVMSGYVVINDISGGTVDFESAISSNILLLLGNEGYTDDKLNDSFTFHIFNNGSSQITLNSLDTDLILFGDLNLDANTGATFLFTVFQQIFPMIVHGYRV